MELKYRMTEINLKTDIYCLSIWPNRLDWVYWSNHFSIADVDFDVAWQATHGQNLPVTTGRFMAMNMAEWSSAITKKRQALVSRERQVNHW